MIRLGALHNEPQDQMQHIRNRVSEREILWGADKQAAKGDDQEGSSLHMAEQE